VNLPVLDFGDDDSSAWREHRSGTGLVAIFLGLEGEGCDYWGVAIRGEGLAVKRVATGEVKDSHEAVREHACAAFSLHGTVYQVPDLAALQKKITASQEMA
jgi:alanine racemase